MLILTGLMLLGIYGCRISSRPPKWEEPRRSLVAMEMIHRQDYIVPRVMGELYLSKPPLHSWLIALVAGAEVQRVTPLRARLVTLAALVGIGLFLWRLGIDGKRETPHLLPALIFLTTGTIVQFGRTGEIDVLFCFFVTAALGCFELGRRRGSSFLQWFVPQLFVAAGVLTKGLAPIFFYPPVLLWAWLYRRDSRFSGPAFTAGLLVMLGLVAAWLVPYAQRAPLGELQGKWASEVRLLTLDEGWLAALLHALLYPFLLVGVALPWSLRLFALRHREARREAMRCLRQDPYLGLATAVVGWGVLVYLFVPGTDGRYLIPFLPFSAVLIARALRPGGGEQRAEVLERGGRHWWFWALLALLLVGYALVAGSTLPGGAVWGSILLGLSLIAAFAYAWDTRRLAGRIPVLLLLGLIYGVAFVGIADPRRAAKDMRLVDTARELATRITAPRPVVCDCGHGRSHQLAFALSRHLGRPVQRRPPAEDGYYWVAPGGAQAPPGSTLLGISWQFSIWEVTP